MLTMRKRVAVAMLAVCLAGLAVIPTGPQPVLAAAAAVQVPAPGTRWEYAILYDYSSSTGSLVHFIEPGDSSFSADTWKGLAGKMGAAGNTETSWVGVGFCA
jgi:hypothetical protein